MSYQYPLKEANNDLVGKIWGKGRVIQRYDQNVWRYDICGKPIRFSDHGNTDSEYGWEIDHIYPSSLGGSDDIDNLQPLQWENNREKGDQYPWNC